MGNDCPKAFLNNPNKLLSHFDEICLTNGVRQFSMSNLAFSESLVKTEMKVYISLHVNLVMLRSCMWQLLCNQQLAWKTTLQSGTK